MVERGRNKPFAKLIGRPQFLSLLLVVLLAGCTDMPAAEIPASSAEKIDESSTISAITDSASFHYAGARSRLDVEFQGIKQIADFKGTQFEALKIAITAANLDSNEPPLIHYAYVDPITGQLHFLQSECATEGDKCINHRTISFAALGVVGLLGLNLDFQGLNASQDILVQGEPVRLEFAIQQNQDCTTRTFAAPAIWAYVMAADYFPTSTTYCNGGIPNVIKLKEQLKLISFDAGAGNPLPIWNSRASNSNFETRISEPTPRTRYAYQTDERMPEEFPLQEALDEAIKAEPRIKEFLEADPGAYVAYRLSGESGYALVGNQVYVESSRRNVQTIIAHNPSSQSSLEFNVEQTVLFGTIKSYKVDLISERPSPRDTRGLSEFQLNAADTYLTLEPYFESQFVTLIVSSSFPTLQFPLYGSEVNTGNYLYRYSFEGVEVGTSMRIDYGALVNAGTGHVLTMALGDEWSKFVLS